MITVKRWKIGKLKEFRIAKGKTGFHIYRGIASYALEVFPTKDSAINFLKTCVQ